MKQAIILVALLVLSACGSDSTSVKVLRGPEGKPGPAGSEGSNLIVEPPAGYTIVEFAQPCDNPNIWNDNRHRETFFRMSDGSLWASFSQDIGGTNTRWTMLMTDITYQTTDATGCTLKLTRAGNQMTLTGWRSGVVTATRTWTATYQN